MKAWPVYARWLFWLACLVVLAAALTPGKYLPSIIFDWWDKAQHALAFAGLAGLGLIAYPSRTTRVLVGLLPLGAGIELAQAATGWRNGDVLDWLADVVGLMLGYGMYLSVKQVVPLVADKQS